MMQLVSPLIPFPNIHWWLLATGAEEVVFDHSEHFVKMSYRNRYYITGANGLIQLSVPLSQGRNQRTPMHEVQIDNKEKWQVQHWRTIFSVYGRAPYFEYYAPSLEQLFTNNFNKLVAFNAASIDWAMQHTGIQFKTNIAETYQECYEDAVDLRKSFRPGIEKKALRAEQGFYYQLFAERNGFCPNLSILDLLFSEGPATKSIIMNNKKAIEGWQG